MIQDKKKKDTWKCLKKLEYNIREYFCFDKIQHHENIYEATYKYIIYETTIWTT